MVKVRKDLTGQTFGRWTVLGQAEDYVDKDGKRYTMWHCKCSCQKGKEQNIRQSNLKSGKTQSCGCLARERRNEMFDIYRKIRDGVYDIVVK